MRTITLEEHFASRRFLEGPGQSLKELARRYGSRLIEQLCDVGDQRLAEMDEAGIDVQVLSLTAPGTEQLDAAEAVGVAHETNDFVASAIEKDPARLAGFASLPTAVPDRAARELEGRVRNQNFRGVVINGHNRGRYLDDKFYRPILECAASLDVPIYLHPTQPPKPVIEASYGGFSPEVTDLMSRSAWGWHIETAVHVIRLILGGVFDRYPKLQIVVGHMGETLPFMLQRLDVMPKSVTKLERSMSDYLRQNVYYTFSGFNFTPVFLNLLLEVGVERIMFSADYPYASMAEARAFLDRLPVSSADKERIAHGNAERLLRF